MSRRPATVDDVRNRRRLFWASWWRKVTCPGKPAKDIGSYDWRHETEQACQSGVMVQPSGHDWWDLGWFEVEEEP